MDRGTYQEIAQKLTEKMKNTMRVVNSDAYSKACLGAVEGEAAKRKGMQGMTYSKNWIIECIIMKITSGAGLFVDFITCDGAAWNRNMWSLMGIRATPTFTKRKVQNPVDPTRSLHFVSDFPHLLKCPRNGLLKQSFNTQAALQPGSDEEGQLLSFLACLTEWELHAGGQGGFPSTSTAVGLKVTISSVLSLLNYLDAASKLRYRDSGKAWMTRELFAKWLTELDKAMVQQKILLILDNCSAHHVNQKLNAVTLTKATAKLQPLVMEIMRNFKVCYCRRDDLDDADEGLVISESTSDEAIVREVQPTVQDIVASDDEGDDEDDSGDGVAPSPPALTTPVLGHIALLKQLVYARVLSNVHIDQLSNLESAIIGAALSKQTAITNFLG
ncbi:hypothetical protein HPB47_003200 [Ixodes persulcatus]|uniref:Uncharacterized protein n=1 Tax=Ixodes persulcatus TaxID=34615 RepID=A0AC60PK89_IXOPE|nr:hypothetical protein HPB47_003200 [Ixodes persulcatus]